MNKPTCAIAIVASLLTLPSIAQDKLEAIAAG